MYMNVPKGQFKFMEMPSPILEVPSPMIESDKLIDESGRKITSENDSSDVESLDENHLGKENYTEKDGPVSLQDSFNGSTMNADTGQSGKSIKDGKSTNQMQKSMSLSSQSEAQNQNQNYAEMNGDVEWEELLNVKNLKEDVLLPKCKKIVEALLKVEEFDRGDAMRLIKSIGDTYWSYRSLRKKIGDILADSGFADIGMKMLKDLNSKGIFKNDSIWFPSYYALNGIWNFTDASLLLAKRIAEADGVRFFTANCSHKPYLDALQNKNVYYVVKSSMSIIHNIARTTGVHQYFKENKTTEVMLSYLNNEAEKRDEMLKILAMLTLSHIVEEDDNDKLIDETGAIEGTIKFIDLALKNERKRYRGFTPHELMDGLSKVAVNDKNKKKIIDAGALPVFLNMLKSENEEDQAMTARAIWTLAFDKDVLQSITQYEEMMPTLEKLKDSPNKDVQKNINGALFVLKGENDVSNRPKSAKNKGHVFLSYSWNEKEMIYKLRDKLKSEGFTVWIDVERMGGSTLTAMAEAVENSAVVLVGMSEKYKQSPNCRLEAEYAFQLRKDYIPIMLQKKYRPDGWLGIILGAKLYFDFSGKYPFEKSWQGLLKELKSLGRVHQRPASKTANSTEQDTTDSPILLHSHPTTSAVPSNHVIQDVVISAESLKMSQEQVSDWLCDLKLDGCVPSMAMFDGKLLCQLKRMKNEAPEFYYQSLEKRLGMSLVEILTFTAALDKL